MYLESLPPGDVVLRAEQTLVVTKHSFVVRLQELSAQHLVLRQQLLKT